MKSYVSDCPMVCEDKIDRLLALEGGRTTEEDEVIEFGVIIGHNWKALLRLVLGEAWPGQEFG